MITTIFSCAKKQSSNQHFTLKLGAAQTGLAISGGTFVHALSATSDSIVKLDANDSAVFDFGTWEFQVVSFEGPSAFAGKRYCGRVQKFYFKCLCSQC